MPRTDRAVRRNRWPVLLGAVSALAVLLLAATRVGRQGGPAGPEGGRPDIVLVVWDTCRADRIQVNGYGRATTPNLAALAARGTVFRSCSTPSPWTGPSHGSLFTGLLPRRHGLREGVGDRVQPGIPLLAETLRAAGYATAAFTANPYISSVTGLDRGFEEILPCYDPQTGKWAAERVAGQVREWLDLRRAKGGGRRPLFLFVNMMDTHLPYRFDESAVEAVHGREAVAAARAAAEVTENAALAHLYGAGRLDARTIDALQGVYDGAVRTDDAALGALLDVLGRDDRLGSAFVAVAGDHGENLGEHGEMSHLLSLHEPVLRVPLVVSWPGRFEAGRVEGAQVRLQDLYPTILDAARLSVPPGCGMDAVTLAERPLAPRVAVSEYGAPFQHLEPARAEFSGPSPGRWERFFHSLLAVREEPAGGRPLKYIATRRYVPATREEVLLGEELFDLAADPGEERNLLGAGARSGDRADAARLRAIGEAWRPPAR